MSDSYFPLSLTQQDIYFDQLHYPDNPMYNIGGYIKLGKISEKIITQAHKRVVSEIESFGIRVVESEAGVSQYISHERTLALPIIDFSDKKNSQDDANKWLDDLFETPIAFKDSELFRAFLLKISETEYWYIGFAHHLCQDGWGFANWAARIGQCYNDLEAKMPIDPTWQDTVEQDLNYLETQKYKKDLAYWVKHYEHLPERLLQPQHIGGISNRKCIPSKRKTLDVPMSNFNKLVEASNSGGVGFNQLLSAIFAVYFNRIYGGEEKNIVFGFPAHNRSNHAQKQMLNVFTSLSPLLLHVDPEQNVIDLAAQIQVIQKKSYRHQRMPIGHIIQALNLPNERKSIFDIGLNFLKLDSNLSIDDQTAELVYSANNHEKTPLMITVWDYGENHNVQIKFDYSCAYFSSEDADMMIKRIAHLIDTVLIQAETRIDEIELLPDGEKQQIEGFSKAETQLYKDRSIHSIFEEKAAENPGALAVIHNGQSLTYGELNEKANRLAHYLLESDVKIEARIGLCVERSLDMIVATLAVLKSGAAYVPLDPSWPEDRLAYMLENSGVQVLLAQSRTIENLSLQVEKTIVFDNLSEQLSGLPSDNLDQVATQLSSDNLAYILYTSGSTGRPKGVMVEHKNVIAQIDWILKEYSDDELAMVLASTSLNFDPHVFEFWAAFGSGNTLLLVENILQLVTDDTVQPTFINTVPSAISVLLDEKKIPASLKVLTVAGEALDKSVVNRAFDISAVERVVNAYGPTEDTIYSTCAVFNGPIDYAPTIGRQIDNNCAYVLDQNQKMSPINIVGELYVGGPGVSRGYASQPELTDERFIQNPFPTVNEPRLFRTGDLVRWLPSGELEFNGRIDNQVKVRGFRVELGEIESNLVSHDDVKETAVVLFEDASQLVAYVSARSNNDFLSEELRLHLSAKLPDYMVPATIIVLDEMPHTPTGKIDRRALTLPVLSENLDDSPLESETEKQVAEIWKDVLGIEQVGATSNFFHIGGQSLLAIRVTSACSRHFNKAITLADLFDNTDIRALSHFIDGQEFSLSDEIEPSARENGTIPSFAQKRLLFIQQMTGQGAQYNIPAAFELNGVIDHEALQKAFSKIVQRHEILRTTYQVVDGQINQTIQEDNEASLIVEIVDLLPQDVQAQALKINELMANEYQLPFDLENDISIRVKLAKLSEDQSILLVTLHHVAADGWSVEVLAKEFSTLYDAYRNKRTVQLAEMPIQYADYALWQEDNLSDNEHVTQLRYWKKQLADLPQVHSLPLASPRPTQQSFLGETFNHRIGTQLTRKLNQLAKDNDVSMFMLLESAFAAIVSRLSGEQDVVIGTPIAGRTQESLKSLIGLFVNTLVMRTDFSAPLSFIQLLKQTRKNSLDAFDNQSLPFERLVDEINPQRTLSHTPLFQLMFVLERDSALDLNLPQLAVKRLDDLGVIAKFDITLQVIEKGDGLSVNWNFAKDIFSLESIRGLAESFSNFLQGVTEQPKKSVYEIPLAAQGDQQLLELSSGVRNYPENKTIHHLFEQHALATPDAIALTYRDQHLRYAMLDQRANQLAHYLIKECDVSSGDLVGVLAGRSIETIIAMLAVLKIGAAYVPLDPSYPDVRLQFILADCSLTTILLPPGLDIPSVLSVCNLVALGDTDRYEQYPNSAPSVEVAPRDVAHIIYTSGSTGQPKGVMVEHINVVRLLASACFVPLNSATVMLQSSSVSFDASTMEIWGSLINGGRLVINDDQLTNFLALNKLLMRQEVNTLWLTAGLFDQWSYDLPISSSIKYLMVGGDVVSPHAVQRTYRAINGIRIINGYGPTENTVFAACYTIPKNQSLQQAIPIGKPVSGSDLYVLNRVGALAAVGELGELHIAGDGLSRGYMNNPELTSEKFVNLSIDGKTSRRLYKTGDLVRWNYDGQLEFVGRLDKQVKVRGFRVELGEIESELNDLEQVSQAVVLVQQDDETKTIVAYVVAVDDIGNDSDFVSQLRRDLGRRLPDYMMPSAFIAMPELPLNTSGKVDKEELPSVDISLYLHSSYVAPRSEIETVLCEVWQELLSIDKVGIHHNFFEIGGDSILSIQVAARAGHQGLNLTTQQIFEHQTIAELATCVTRIDANDVHVLAEQQAVVGELMMLPIQKSFLEGDSTDQHHYNQSLLLKTEVNFTVEGLQLVVRSLMERHDSLRLRFSNEQEKWQARYADFDDAMLAECCVIEEMPSDEEGLIQRCQYWQSSLDIGQGPTVRFINFTNAGGPGRFLIILHHLIVDGVSWRILLTDFAKAYEQYTATKRISLDTKSCSMQQWGRWISDYSNTDSLRSEVDYWCAQFDVKSQGLPLDHLVADIVTNEHVSTVHITLTKDETTALLQRASKAYNSQINELLLAGVFLGVSGWTQESELLLSMEGHGREVLDSGLNFNETIGWFTSIYPLLLRSSSRDVGDVIKAIKEQYRFVPNNGLGYGVLRYISNIPALVQLSKERQPEIVFNYLGQFDNVLQQQHLFDLAQEDSGDSISRHRCREHALGFNGKVVNSVLIFDIDYSERQFDRETIERLASDVEQGLRQVIEHCTQADNVTYTPSDFPLADITQHQLDEWHLSYSQIQDVYPATAMQKGMLFHSMMHQDAYCAQLYPVLSGVIDYSLFKRAWQTVTQRHDILRTVFVGQDSALQQLVLKTLEIDWYEEDISNFSATQQSSYIDEYQAKDVKHGFNFEQGPMMRIALFDLGDERHQLVWTHHHILLDGWCLPILYREVVAAYLHMQGHLNIELQEAPKYRGYVSWLKDRDIEAAKMFWSSQLSDIEVATVIPVDKSLVVDGTDGYQEITVDLTADQSDQLSSLARDQKTTVNTLCQLAWGYLLHRMTGLDDVIFGATISGRSAEIENVEQMIGLFINTIPVTLSFENENTVADKISKLHREFQACSDQGFLPLIDILRQSSVESVSNLFDSLLVFENYPLDLSTDNDVLSIESMHAVARSNYKLTVSITLRPTLHIKIEYREQQFERETILNIADRFKHVLLELDRTKTSEISCINITTETERELLNSWNDNFVSYDKVHCIHELIEQQVERSPDAVALIFDDDEMSYRQLNSAANQLAHKLVKLGVGAETMVGLSVERSAQMVIAMMAILKAGAAYVPLDASYPADRLRYMIQDARLKLVLTQRRSLDKFRSLEQCSEVDILALDENDFRRDVEASSSNNIPVSESKVARDNLAYMIYTSGSTGQPKGVMLSHSNLSNYLQYAAQNYLTDSIEGSVVSSPLAFDATVTTLLVPLLVGKSVELLLDDDNLLERLADYLSDDDENLLFKITPSHLDAISGLMPVRSSAKHVIVIGGEQLTASCINSWRNQHLPSAIYINEYGPTETVVGCCVYRLEPGDVLGTPNVPIGKPISNMQLHVLSKDLSHQPIGGIGELYISGPSLARGYFEQEKMTADKFILSPFDQAGKSKLYKTGDLVRRCDSGDLEFIGRVDDQIKIRGFRVELGEIEAKLNSMEKVSESIVICRTGNTNQARDKKLVAYIVPTDGLDSHESFITFVTSSLAGSLPDYMVPSSIILLESLPLTANGKVDKQRLPAPTNYATSPDQFIAPKTELEKTISDIWSDLLDVSSVSSDANFFELGGDSIVSIQMVSRIRKAGFKVKIRDVFDYPTIAGLALCCKAALGNEAHQESVEGELCLLPVQRHFLETVSIDQHHFNQSVLFETPDGFDSQFLPVMLTALMNRHDALRLRFVKDGQLQWQAEHTVFNHEAIEKASITEMIPVDCNDTSLFITERSEYWQAQFDLATGPLIRAIHFSDERVSHASNSRLLIVIHHLVVDVMSWRIMLVDIEQAYKQFCNGQDVVMSSKTSSLQAWGDALKEYSNSNSLADEKLYWLQQYRHEVAPIKADMSTTAPFVKDSASNHLSLNKADTHYLLAEANKAHNTQTNELLITALFLAVSRWQGRNSLRILLEGHGREPMSDLIDLSETVGWFTSYYPLTLICSSEAIGDVIVSVKEQYRGIPNNGIGYGVLHYLTQDEDLIALSDKAYPQLCFNYLGQFDQSIKQKNQFQIANESNEHHISPRQIRLNPLVLNGKVINGQFDFELDYSQQEYLAPTMDDLANHISMALKDVINHCKQTESTQYSPSDFPMASVTQPTFASWLKKYPTMCNLYPATVMQQGILFTSLLDVSTYMIQVCVEFKGGLQIDQFKDAWRIVTQRHEILRTAFVGLNETLHQLVLASVDIPWDLHDWQSLSGEQQEHEFANYLVNDRARGFDFETAGLSRFSLFQLAEDRYRFIWCHHHILTDGWSSALIYKEVMTCYQSLSQNSQPVLEAPVPYENYVYWTLEQDYVLAEQYWADRLEKISAPTLLAIDKLVADSSVGYQRKTLSLTEQQTQQLTLLAKKQHTTVNNLLQVAWGYLLHCYSGDSQVVFGVTVSGRAAEVPGIESMVGLFINSIPMVMDFSENTKTSDLIEKFHRDFHEGNDYSYLPLSEIQRQSKVASGMPLFDTLLMFANYPMDAGELTGRETVTVENVWVDDRAGFKIAMDAKLDTQLSIVFGYESADFSTSAIDRMTSHLSQILTSLAANIDSDIHNIDMLTRAEKQQFEQWNDTRVDWDLNQSVHEMFELQVSKTPDAIAVEFENQSLSYHRLNERANKVAHGLINAGIGCDSIVPVLTHRNIEFLISVLGILKAGAAYLPLDPNSPSNRYAEILAQSNFEVMICEDNLRQKLSDISLTTAGESKISILRTSDLDALPVPANSFPCRSKPNSLAYVIFTSGSTGVPKGAMLTNGGLINHVRSKIRDLDLDSKSVIAQTASQCFDISVWQFLTPILVGGRVCIFNKTQSHEATSLIDRALSRSVTVLEIVPSLMRMLIELMEDAKKPLHSLEWLIPTGEVLPVPLAERWLRLYPQVPILNAYGPTECTDDVCLYKMADLPESGMSSIPIGNPVSNFKLYVLNDRLHQLPVGVVGELYIGGLGVGRGYLGDKRQTDSVFMPDLFSGVNGSRMYKSGDLVRRLGDGSLDFIGRVDQQVKVRGFRIELGEVESHLCKLDALDAAVVITDDRTGDTQLVAYVIATVPQGGLETAVEFRRHIALELKQHLPEYMVPTAIVEMDKFPLNANGKIDKQALPAASFDDPDESFLAPENDIEETLVSIWAELLGVQTISTNSNFFEIGGHSLLAMRLVTACSAQLSNQLSLVSLYEHSTIQSLARHIMSLDTVRSEEIEVVDRVSSLPLSYGQQSLWIIDQLSGGSPQYNIPAAFDIKGELDLDVLHLALDELIQRHEILRTTYLSVNGEGFQHVHNNVSSEIDVVDIVQFSPAEQINALERMKLEEASKVFDLSRDFPIRVKVIQLAESSYILLLTAHHIASDAWSVSIMLRDTMSYYNSFRQGIEFELPELTIQYADFASWQRSTFTLETLEGELEFWSNELSNIPKLHRLPTDRLRPPLQDFRGQTFVQQFDVSTTAALNQFASQRDVSLFMFLQTVFSVLIGQFSKDEDIVIGCPVAGRSKSQIEPLIGYFVNALIMRTDLSDDPVFSDLLDTNKQKIIQSFDNQNMPFEMLVDGLQSERSLSHSPIFQLVFSVRNTESTEFDFSGLLINDISNEDLNAKFDLVLNVEESSEGLHLYWIYATSLFDLETIENMANGYEALLASVIDQPEQRLSQLEQINAPRVALTNQPAEQTVISGYAIVLSDIEHSLLQLSSISDAVVACVKDGNIDQLVGYILPTPERKGEGDEWQSLFELAIRSELEEILPDYMVPKLLVVIESLPRDDNGQVDVLSLPTPDFTLANGFIRPSGDIECALEAIWKELLIVKNISANDSFFNLGGQSLTAIRLIVEIKEVFDVELELRDVFQHQSIIKLAVLIENEQVRLQNLNLVNDSNSLFEIEI